MKRVAILSLAVALFVAALGVAPSNDVQAQGAGLVSSLLNRMERNRQSLKSLRAQISMTKWNAQLRDEDKTSGTVAYVPAAGRNAYVRIDWQHPQRETLAVSNGQYTLYRQRLNMAYKGTARSGRAKASGAFEFLNMSRQQLQARFQPMQYLGEETLWGGVNTSHIKLVPKGGASYQYAEVWVDNSGLPVQVKVVERNDDATTVRLTNVQRNPGVSLDEFNLNLDSSVKIVKG